MPPGTAPRPETTRAPDADAHLLAALRAGDEAAFAALVTPLPREPQAGRARLREHRRRRRGGRAGHVARGHRRDRPLPGARDAQDLGLPHPRQQGQVARHARAAHRAVRVACRATTTTVPPCPPTTSSATGTRGRATGRRRRGRGRTPSAGWSRSRRASGCATRSRRCRTCIRRSSRCATSRASTRREVCALLELSDGNQRVILHRARARVRADLARYFEEPA